MVNTLGELKTGDTFYLIHWQGGHISSIESKVVDSILDIKIGRIIHYDTDKENKTGLGLTLKTNELNENVIDYHFKVKRLVVAVRGEFCVVLRELSDDADVRRG